MRNCVATYADACLAGRSSIWSLRVENARGRHAVMTLEVDERGRQVVQARRRCNALPKEEDCEWGIVRRWADAVRVEIAPWATQRRR